MGKAPTGYIVRMMQEADIPYVVDLEAEAFPQPWPESAFFEELNNPLAVYLVLEGEGLICGYAGFWLIFGEAQVTNIVVLASKRGIGLGRMLVSTLLEVAATLRAETAVLEVRKTNQVAQSLYSSLGFSQCGLRTGYYQDNGEDAVLMRKNFLPEEEQDG